MSEDNIALDVNGISLAQCATSAPRDGCLRTRYGSRGLIFRGGPFPGRASLIRAFACDRGALLRCPVRALGSAVDAKTVWQGILEETLKGEDLKKLGAVD
jgi:hypothetical protein